MRADRLRDRCPAVARSTLAHHDWALTSGDDPEFCMAVTARAAERLGAHPNPSEKAMDDALAWAVRNAYSRLLYEAFQQEGSERQWQAMTEVKRFAYSRLRHTTGGDERLANNCADDAVSQAWLRLPQVRDPGRFLGFVLQIGVNFVRAAQKPPPLDAAPETGSETRWLEELIETDEFLRRLHDAIRGCLTRPEEVRVVMAHVVLGRSYIELAEEWDVRAARLHLLKFRAMEKLRRCEAFVELEREWRSASR